MAASQVPITPGIGAPIAVDTVGGVNFQTVKLDSGLPGASAPVNAGNPLPVAFSSASVSYTDRSGAITTGGQAKVLAPANPPRRGFWVQNTSLDDLWIDSIGDAALGSPSLKLLPNALYESPPGGCPSTALSINGAVAGQSYSAREW